jgi:hypothetical protein
MKDMYEICRQRYTGAQLHGLTNVVSYVILDTSSGIGFAAARLLELGFVSWSATARVRVCVCVCVSLPSNPDTTMRR